MPSTVRIGTQGWNYDAWVGPFYPPDTRVSDFLAVYARAFDTVEVDSTFYAVPPERTIQSWAERTPGHFTFALKLPQEITHEHRLRDCADLTAQFFDRVRTLGSKLGPVLVQLGPEFGPSELPALASFLPTLPRDAQVAVEFRQRVDSRGRARAARRAPRRARAHRRSMDPPSHDACAGRKADGRLRVHSMDGT